MYLIRKSALTLSLMVMFTALVYSQSKPNVLSMNEIMPINPKIKTGKLSNGIQYFIMENKKPEKKAELRLLIKTGSTNEDKDQLGLAHFIEHMSFNGTKNFPKNELIEFLQKTGVRFGADLNASTGFDRTMYILPISLENEELYEKSFQVLEDWAHNDLLTGEDIDGERGIIIAEWRQRMSFQKRLQDAHLKKVLKGSVFTERDVIGDTNIIKNCPHDALRRYYKDWYRPDLMAVVVVGDIDVNDVEKKVKEHFGRIEPVQNPRKSADLSIPYVKEPQVSIATDKQMPMTMLQIYFKHDQVSNSTYNDYRESIKRSLYDIMFGQRLQELSKDKNAPFLQAQGGFSDFIGNINVYSLAGIMKEDNILGGYDALLTEAYRVYKHGFTASELERAKKDYASSLEKAFNEKDKTETGAFIKEIASYYYENVSMPGIDIEKACTDAYLPTITLDEVNALAKKYLRKENTVITVSAPEKLADKLPKEEILINMLNEAPNKKIDAYQDNAVSKPLFNRPVTPGKITKITKSDDIGSTTIELDNGAKVILKPTDFKNDEILFTAVSKGGTSLVDNKNFISADAASDIANLSGLADFTDTQLQKLLAGKNVTISTSIDNYTESVGGYSTPQDLETLFQLINLSFTAPRKDDDAFVNFIDKQKEELKNKSLNPENTMNDTIGVTMNSHHFRSLPLTESMLSQIDPKFAYEFYKEKFANPGDFTFIFVGNFDVEAMKPLIINYIGSIPSAGKPDKIKDLGMNMPKGMVSNIFQKGIEPKANVRIIFNGKFEYNDKEAYLLKSLVDVLRIKITEDLREEKGGIYSPGVYQTIERTPDNEYSIQIAFTCAPDDVNKLVTAAIAQAEKLRTEIKEDDVTKVKAADKNQIEISLKNNAYWLRWLASTSLYGGNLSNILNKESLINELNSKELKEAANKFINPKNMIKVIMYPENYEIDD